MIGNYIAAALNIAAIIFVNTKAGKEMIKKPVIRGFITIGGGAAVAFIAWKESKNIEKYFRDKKFKAELVNQNNPTAQANPTGAGGGASSSGQVDLKSIAARIYKAIWKTGVFNAAEDETAAYEALLEITPADAARLATVYNQLYGETLKEDFTEYVFYDLEPGQQTVLQSYLNSM